MATQITDLDAVLGDPKKVRLGGRIYTLPPDLPVELYLRINQFAKEGLGDVEMVERLRDELLELFRYADKTIKTLPLSMTQLVTAIGTIYGSSDTEETPARPPRTRGGATSSSRKSRTRSRS
jgi:hypothetical protein